MNFLGLHKRLKPIHLHWVYFLNDPDSYEKVRIDKISFSSIALYSREETLKKAKHMNDSYFTPHPLKELIEIIEDADK